MKAAGGFKFMPDVFSKEFNSWLSHFVASKKRHYAGIGLEGAVVYGAKAAYGWVLGKHDPLVPVEEKTAEEWKICANFHAEQYRKMLEKIQKQYAEAEKLADAIDFYKPGNDWCNNLAKALTRWKNYKKGNL